MVDLDLDVARDNALVSYPGLIGAWQQGSGNTEFSLPHGRRSRPTAKETKSRQWEDVE